MRGHVLACFTGAAGTHDVLRVVIVGRVENWVAAHPRPLARAIAVRLLFLASPKGERGWPPNRPFMEKLARFGYTAPKRGSVLREDSSVEETCDGPQDHRDQGR